MSEAKTILEKLAAPFPSGRVHWRVGATNQKSEARKSGNQNAPPTHGFALAYLDARDVMERLDEVCGAMWQCRHDWSDGKRLQCSIGILIGDQWVWRSDGAGDTNMEAEKGAFSGAFKRAAVQWGIGRYLYSVPAPWVELSNKQIPTEQQKQLQERLDAWQRKMFGGE